MKRMRFYMMLAMVCCAVVSVRAQGHGWVQYSFSGAYENYAHTFENSGYTLTGEAEGHSKRRVYGAFLVGLSTYEGSKPITLESDLGPVSDNLADKKTQMLFALGPGFDLLSNQIDRFYLNLYGGYAVVDYEYDVCDDVLRDSRDENLNGFWGMARLGYEHQFGRSFSLGGFLQGAYVGEEFNWGIGLRIGFRTSDFRWKKPSASY